MEALEITRVLIVLAGTGAAAYFDIFNRKNVPDCLLFAFLCVSLVVNILDPSAFITNLVPAALFVALFFFLYRRGQIGGADVVIAAAIYATLPTIQDPLLAKPALAGIIALPSVIPIFIVATFLMAFATLLKYLPAALERTLKGKMKFGTFSLIGIGLLVVVYAFFLITVSPLIGVLISPAYPIVVTVVVLVVGILTLFKDFIMDSMVVMKKAEQEDVLAIEKIDERTMKKLKLGRLVTIDQLKRMQRLKRKWPVLDLPMFLPYVLIALLAYILLGDPLFYLM
jgi:Flp pilus assembly protein protease CpaA